MLTKRHIFIGIAAIALVGVVAFGSYVAYIYISGGSGEASTDIENVVQPAIRPNDLDATEETDTSEDAPDATQVPTVVAESASDTTDTESEGSDVRFTIVSEESEVRFLIGEEYSGVDITVVGSTNQVGGEILVDPETPTNSFIGPITINLRTLETDIELRNRAIRSQILHSAEDEYEFTDFVPTEIQGLPDEINIGEAFLFTVIGDMALVDITNTLTFEVTVTPISDDRIKGVAKTTISRSDYGLDNFNVPRQVGRVDDEVRLEIEFVAQRVVE